MWTARESNARLRFCRKSPGRRKRREREKRARSLVRLAGPLFGERARGYCGSSETRKTKHTNRGCGDRHSARRSAAPERNSTGGAKAIRTEARDAKAAQQRAQGARGQCGRCTDGGAGE